MSNPPPGYLAFQASTHAWYDLLRTFGFSVTYDDAETICMYVTAIEEILRRPVAELSKRPRRQASQIARKSVLENQ